MLPSPKGVLAQVLPDSQEDLQTTYVSMLHDFVCVLELHSYAQPNLKMRKQMNPL